MRVLVKSSIFSSRENLERLSAAAVLPAGSMSQLGTRRASPDVDLWAYSTPWFSLHFDNLDEELRNFVCAHGNVGSLLQGAESTVEIALVTLCPVEEEEGETFTCLIDSRTLAQLAAIGLGLEVAPAPCMPEAPYWKA